jgi:hypothetical protein
MEGPIRYKNLLDDAEDRLVARGIKRPEAHAILAQAWGLHGEADFWRTATGRSIALFAAPGFFEYFRLALDVPELVVLGDRFHIKPLLPFLTGDGRFYVLALSQNQVRLLEGDRFSVREVGLDDDTPKSLAEALKYDQPVESRQFHTRTDNPASSEMRGGVFFGTGAAADQDNKDEILRWFKDLEDGVEKRLAGDRAPLVLAGVEYLLPLYRQASGYRYILDEVITGNQDEKASDELHKAAWQLVEPHFKDDERAAREAFAIQAGRGLSLSSLEEVLRAAHDGRVEVLFVPRDRQRWGRYDPIKRRVTKHQEYEPGDQDLLDLAAVQTLAMGGTVYVVDPEEIPNGGNLAAAVRY